MKSLVCTTPGRLAYGEMNAPVIVPGHAIIKIKRIGICGTDLHAWEGTQPFFNYPRILGHELSGDLVVADNAPGFVPGEAVTIIPYFSCGTCIACRSGKSNCCTKIQVCGVHIDGGMVEYLSVPSDALVHGNGLSYDELALIEPLAIGAHGIQRAAVKPGEFVLVVGAGPIGLAAMEFARIAGAQVIAMDVNVQRLYCCKEKLDILHLIHATSTADVLKRISHITNGDMPTVIIDATGNLNAINNSFHYLAHGGRYVLIGLQKEDIVFSHPEFHKREATLMSSRNATRADFEQVIAAMKNGLINPAAYITHHIAFDELKDAFPGLLQPEAGVIKAMVTLT
ncbi:2-desacetyl-2-hydroxyethyl bacteriochlorophyllide A dehydrogenase [Chitinophaga niastensis]|uniref:2-desacetyl-2-hydroxyethyl bacteriochlorophyllide A dehydrogenase n=1 Tax=Chitinophaga niastensis TaxID=536980 RepID=A0A2P8HHE2_CHINA|nr:zinc-binding alcohol dehydrogenase family protein [Chitinophaga niastensis]PSL45633.1 2-desacetyl-2-hydroxyethyl bacteriochlorophyllide A dehydrogenase [Chitinophaga niastensis]